MERPFNLASIIDSIHVTGYFNVKSCYNCIIQSFGALKENVKSGYPFKNNIAVVDSNGQLVTDMKHFIHPES